MEQAIPNITHELQAAISRIEADLHELDSSRRAKRVELKKHQKALKALSSPSGARKGEVYP